MLLFSVFCGIALLLLLVLYARIPAFMALLLASLTTGLLAGLPPQKLVQCMQDGMGSTLGFVATVVGLGAFFGALLEHSGGAQALASWLIRTLGLRLAPFSMALTGFLISIPVFFDVAFIILMPVLGALQRRSGQSLLLFAVPLLTGLAVAHAFVPPTPGPVAVARILGADLGWTIVAGILVGVPVTLFCGLYWGKKMAARIRVAAPAGVPERAERQDAPPAWLVVALILTPIVLILLETSARSGLLPLAERTAARAAVDLLGTPFVALLAANLLAWIALGLRRGYPSKILLDITTRSLAPAGAIILVTGAGGVFKQVLIETGAGKMLAEQLAGRQIPVFVLAFLAAATVRVLQGSATVAMITAAGIVAPMLAGHVFHPFQNALLVVAIAAGATTSSHVNDSGFWLVKQYLGLSESETFRVWTMLTTLIALCAIGLVALIWWLGFG
ncbi:MAG: gluconate transporter [Saprospirales bacterium]|nr:gluconate transporter [Saprospirales bacterium]